MNGDASMKITIRQIEGFLAVAECGQFSQASRRLNTAQPALSQAIKELEAELAVRLFDRTTRRVELTEAGEEFRAAAAKIMEDLTQAVGNAKGVAERRRGKLRIAAPPLLAAAVLPQAITEYKALYPDITVELSDVGTEEIVESVRSGKADCGLGTFPPIDDGIQHLALVRDRLMVFCAKDHAFVEKQALCWSELVAQPVITLTRQSGIRLLTEVGFETAQLLFRPAYEVTQVSTAIALVEAGLGVAVLPTYAAAAVQDRKVVTRPLREPDLAREISLIQSSTRSAVPALTGFVPILRRVAQQLAPYRDG